MTSTGRCCDGKSDRGLHVDFYSILLRPRLQLPILKADCHGYNNMAFQTSILRDGEWVTETVNLQAALKASATPKAATRPHLDPPSCGFLSRTIVESPIVHWILPARLRSEAHNDIAFVG
ncbi:hypothetical protein E4U53_001725, partial [Claviceps sorghi]